MSPLNGNVPEAIRDLRQWLLWRTETPRGRKPTKVPYQASSGRKRADSTDPDTWRSLRTAVRFAERKAGFGVGFVLSADDPCLGADLDDCRNPTTGDIHPAAQAIIADFATYAEVSPSGCGVHILGFGSKNGSRSKSTDVEWKTDDNRASIELYDRGRYLTFTGDRLPERMSRSPWNFATAIR